MKALNESDLKSHKTVSVDSCTYYSRGKSGTRSLAERSIVQISDNVCTCTVHCMMNVCFLSTFAYYVL